MKETLFSPAKINLRLDITGRDPASGYHYLDMLLVPVSLGDRMTVEPADRLTVTTLGCAESIPSEKNIVHRVIRAVEQAIGRELPPLAITIHKEVPTGAGMGGGSGNGATILEYIDRRFALGLGRERLSTIAAPIGSDIPFFLYRSPALVGGFGEQIEPVSLPFFPFHLLAIHPGFGVDTKSAYALWDKKMLTNRRPLPSIRDRVFSLGSLADWMDVLHNDFEIPVLGEYPLLDEIGRAMTAEGAVKALLTGSGATMIGFFTDEKQREQAFVRLAVRYGFVRKIGVIV